MEKKTGAFDKLTLFIENRISPPLIKLSNMKYLRSLQNSFLALMPYMILGATATLINNLPGLFSKENGLDLPGVQKALTAIITPISPILLQVVFVTINLLALLVCLLNGYNLGKINARKYHVDVNENVTSVLSAVSFLCFIDFASLSKNFDWPAYIMGSPSLFAGIIISIIAVELYTFFIRKHMVIKMPEGVPPMIAEAFVSIIPVTIIVILMALLGQGIPHFDFLQIFGKIFGYLVIGGSNWFTQFIGWFLDRLLWFVGLHGTNIVTSVMGPIWTKEITDNIAAFAAHRPIPYMFTEQWINNYVRISVFPIALLCLISKVKRFNVVGKLALPGTIFNIAEPIMFGLPIVLNPIMFVPWVIGFSATFLFNAALSFLGIAPPMIAMTVWTMPAPLAAFIGSGFRLSALLISLLNFVLIFFIFYPFFKVLEKQELKLELEDE
ncbi:MAG: PTS transporter subunit EIIC [Streptococcaceae bacterium]|jgi:PTS system cellobiose-specific IIC component|nr:PTS transporter subunit EIIC [Streptococcaceae bacterium]